MTTPAAAAASSGGPVVPPPVIIPALPAEDVLQSVVATPGGVAASLLDIYKYLRTLGNSVQGALSAHYSSNNVTHDKLEAQIEFKRSQLTEHTDKSAAASELIGRLRTSEAAMTQKLINTDMNTCSLISRASLRCWL